MPLYTTTGERGAGKNKWINDSPLRGGMSPSLLRFIDMPVLSCLVPLLLATFPSLSSSSSEMLFVVAFINQHSADAASVPSFFLFPPAITVK